MPLLHLLRRWHDRWTSMSFSLSCLALVTLASAYLVEVVCRYVFSAPTLWASETAQYALCASVALALPDITRNRGHVAITSLVERLTPRHQAVLQRWIHAGAAACLLALTAVFIGVTVDQARQGLETVSALAIPKWWITAVVACGFADAALHLVWLAVGVPGPSAPASPH